MKFFSVMLESDVSIPASRTVCVAVPDDCTEKEISSLANPNILNTGDDEFTPWEDCDGSTYSYDEVGDIDIADISEGEPDDTKLTLIRNKQGKLVTEAQHNQEICAIWEA